MRTSCDNKVAGPLRAPSHGQADPHSHALFGGGPAPVPGSVSYTVAWSGVQERVNIKNADPVYGGFAGEFVHTGAQMEWTATVGDYHFVSAPLETSFSSFAEVGHERNGIFFPQG